MHLFNCTPSLLDPFSGAVKAASTGVNCPVLPNEHHFLLDNICLTDSCQNFPLLSPEDKKRHTSSYDMLGNVRFEHSDVYPEGANKLHLGNSITFLEETWISQVQLETHCYFNLLHYTKVFPHVCCVYKWRHNFISRNLYNAVLIICKFLFNWLVQ